MRLWSIHPRYLDRMGLLAAWREGLLAQKVLEGKTKGYRSHPQLARFREEAEPVKAIGAFLIEIEREAAGRGYAFDRSKIREQGGYGKKIGVNEGQIEYEWQLLKRKLQERDKDKYNEINSISSPELNPVFARRMGGIEGWEKTR